MEIHTFKKRRGARRRQRIELLRGKTLLSELEIVDLKMRVADSVVRMGGIGDVHTQGKFRRKGYARRCLEFANEWMYENGYDMSVLFGIANFYHRFGFVSALPDYELSMRTTAAESARQRMKVRLMRRSDCSDVQRIYNDANRYRTGSVVRETGEWRGAARKGSLVVVDRSGSILGYAAVEVREDSILVRDIAARDTASTESLLPAIAQQAVEARFEEIRFLVPYDHPVVDLATRLGASFSVRWNVNRSGMARIINLASLLKKISGALKRRLAAANMLGEMRSMSLCTDLGNVTLTRDGDALAVTEDSTGRLKVHMPQMQLTQLVMGYAAPEVVSLEPGVKVSSKAMALLKVMFPKGHPHCWRPDRF